MLLEIPISDNYEEIDNEYRNFKHNLFQKNYKLNDISFQKQVNLLLISINEVLQKSQNNIEISDDNIIRVLIGIKTLSKFSVLNQNMIFQFFSVINDKFPKSFSKLQFFIKYIIRKAKKQSNLQWDILINIFHSKILAMNTNKPNDIEYCLIYIGFLIRYYPDFVTKFSSELILHLIQIIQTENYTLDLNYDIVKLINQTADTYFNDSDINKYYSNYAIELLRKIFDGIKFFNFFDIEISQLFEWKPIIKALAMISVIFEKCPKWFIKKNIRNIHDFLNSIDDSNPEIQCLLTRNKIFYLINEEKDEQINLLFDKNQEENVICGLIQNIKLLLSRKSLFELSNINNEKINELILFCFDKNNLKNSAFDLLNSCILYNKVNQTNYFEIDSKIFECLIQNDLCFDYCEVLKFLKEKNEKIFIGKVLSSINQRPIETLQFIKDEKMKDYFSSNEAIINSIFELIDHEDYRIKSLSIFVASQISPDKFLSEINLKKLFHLLSSDSYSKVKVCILRCFYNFFDDFSRINFEEKLLNCDALNVFNLLLHNNSIHRIQIETVKIISKLAQFKSLKLKKTVKPYLTLFVNQNDTDIQDILISAEFLPFIFDSFPHYIQKYFQSFYDISMDLMNLMLNSKDKYVKHSKLNINNLKEKNFLQTVFCSYIQSLEIIVKKNPAIIKPFFEEIINFCCNCLESEIDQLETQYILSLLKTVLFEMGLKEVISNNKIKSVNLLFTIVYQAGSRFLCSKIHQDVFQILGFLGAQPLFDYTKPLFKNLNEKDKLNIKLQNELIKFGKHKSYDNIYYVFCTNLLIKTLENDSMKHVHIQALDIFLDLIKMMPFNKHTLAFLKDHISLLFHYIEIIINKDESDDKKRLNPIIQKMIKCNKSIINDKINDFVKLFVDLCNYGSIEAFPLFVRCFRLEIKQYINMFVPLIQYYDDTTAVLNALSSVFMYVRFDPEQYCVEEQVIGILIQLEGQGNLQVIHLINNNFAKIQFIDPHVKPIAEMCVNYLKSGINISNEFLDDTVKLLCKLMNNHFEVLKYFVPSIKVSLKPFQSQFDRFVKSLPNNGNDGNIDINTANNEPLTKQSKASFKLPNEEKKPSQPKTSFKLPNEETQSNHNKTSFKLPNEETKPSQPKTSFNLPNKEAKPNHNKTSFKLSNEETKPSQPKTSFKLSNEEAKPSQTKTNFKLPNEETQSNHNKTSFKLPNEEAKPSQAINRSIPNNEAFKHNNTTIRSTNTESKKPSRQNQPLVSPRTQRDIFIQLIISIDYYIKNDNNSLCSDLWINDLIYFCIKNSPNSIIKSCFPISKISQSFAVSLFYYAFHSMISSGNEFINFREDRDIISTTFLTVLRSDKISHHCKSILTDLIEFMDRMYIPLFEPDNFKNSINSIFSNKPSISLRYSLLKFEKNLTSKFKEEILNDLQQSYLNCGSFDQFEQVFQMKNENEVNQISLISNYLEDRIKLGKDEVHLNIISQLSKINLLIQNYMNSNQKNDQIKEEINNEINIGFEFLSQEGGPNFSQGFSSVIQLIIYGQKLIELKEMISSNYEQNNNLQLRFLNSSKIISFLPQIYLINMSSIGKTNDSFIDKLNLLSFCRQNNEWNLMNIIYNAFYKIKENIPIEIQYEMMYNKIFNNLTNEEEIDNLMNEIQIANSNKDLLKFVQYQKALFISRNETKDITKLETIINLCQSLNNNSNAIELCGLTNLKIFELTKDSKRLNESMKNYIESSLLNERSQISNILIIIYLLFTYYNNDDDDDDVKIDQISELLNKIPLHFFIDSMSQFISYITTLKNNSFSNFILNLLTEILIQYPQGVIYDFSFSIFSDQKLDGIEIIESPINRIKKLIKDESIQKIFSEVDSLTTNLINVNATAPIENGGCDLFLLSPNLKENREMKLPVFGTYHYNKEIIYIHEISPKYKEIKSLENPKEISIIGSDGNEYPFILKEKEDLRTDQRIMIFHKFLNQYLKFKIKTYSIIPLTSNQGLIQFVQEMLGISKIIRNYRRKVAPKDVNFEINYLDKNLYKLNGDYLNAYDMLTVVQRLENFRNLINNEQRGLDLKNCFWHFTTSSEKWLNFISNFTSSCAVISIVTYIIGLGDRHLKNIMISKDSGILMNIDFCDVFEVDQKRNLVPEKVPFRLTRNMVAALGPSGVNGCFMKYCEETLSIMRENKDKIFKILKVFVDSPIQQVNSYSIFSLIRDETELSRSREFANQSLKRINKKLNGTDTCIIYSDKDDIDDDENVEKISVHEHVKRLIEFATNEKNLCLLYSDWEPWK